MRQHPLLLQGKNSFGQIASRPIWMDGVLLQPLVQELHASCLRFSCLLRVSSEGLA